MSGRIPVHLDWNFLSSNHQFNHLLQALQQPREVDGTSCSSLNLVCTLIQNQDTKYAFVDYLLRHGINQLDENAQEITLSVMMSRLECFVSCRGFDEILLRYLQHSAIPVHLKQITQQVLMSWIIQQDQYNPHEVTAAAMLSAFEVKPAVNPMSLSNGHQVALESMKEQDRMSKKRRTDDFPTLLNTDVIAHSCAMGRTENANVPAWMTATIMSALTENAWIGDLLTSASPSLPSSSLLTGMHTTEQQLEKVMSSETNRVNSAIAMVEVADRNHDQSSVPVESRDNHTAEEINKAHTELLTRCRAHRTQVLRALGTTSASGGGGSAIGRSKTAITTNASSMSNIGQGLTPKVQQQLSNAACGLIVQIADDLQTWTNSLGSRGVIIKQTHALLSLALYRAPDELIAAITTDVLQSVASSKGGPTDRNSVASALVLVGILLPRVRLLTAPASRWLLRAVETAVKIVPDLAISTLLARSVRRQGMGISGSHGHAQCELLQRVARQVLSKEQCDSLIYHICTPAHQSTSTASVYGVTCSSMGQPLGGGIHARIWTTIELVDTLLSPTLLSTLPSTSHNNSNNPSHHHDNKKSTGSMTEPSVAEQDQIAAAWMDNNQNAETTNNDPLPSFNPISTYDPELLKLINSILSTTPQLSSRSLSTLLSYLNTLSLACITDEATTAANGNAAIATNTIAALSTLMHTVVTKYMTVKGTNSMEGSTTNEMKKEGVAILSRCKNVVAKTALTALQKSMG